MSTLYASFIDAESAERAAAALLDHGALAQDLSIVASERYVRSNTEALTAEATAKSGITTTTAADAGIGAVKGSVAGLGIGILGAIAALFIPGLGVVLGGGALAAAVGAAAASTAAGAAAGGVAGYLKDQGMGEEMALRYTNALEQGGAILAISIPSGDMTAEEIEPYLVKYGALNVSTHNAPRNLSESHAVMVEPIPDVVSPISGTPVPVAPVTVAPVAIAPVAVEPPLVPTGMTSMATVPTTAGAVAAAVNAADVRPTLVDPVTGQMREGVVIDPLTGVERPVRNINGAIVYVDAIPGPAAVVEPVVAAPAAVQPAMVPATSGFALSDVTPTEIDPVSGVVTRGTVADPVTGTVREVRVVNGSIVYADLPYQP